MKIALEINQVSHICLNNALKDFSQVLNQHFAAAKNTIHLEDEKDDSYDISKGKTKHHWVMKISLQWEKVENKS